MTQHTTHENHPGSVFAGLVVGLLAGAATALLMAPHSGKETRDQIQHKGIELRDQMTSTMEGAMSQVRSLTNQISIGGTKKMKELQRQSADFALEKLDQISAAIK